MPVNRDSFPAEDEGMAGPGGRCKSQEIARGPAGLHVIFGSRWFWPTFEMWAEPYSGQSSPLRARGTIRARETLHAGWLGVRAAG